MTTTGIDRGAGRRRQLAKLRMKADPTPDNIFEYYMEVSATGPLKWRHKFAVDKALEKQKDSAN